MHLHKTAITTFNVRKTKWRLSNPLTCCCVIYSLTYSRLIRFCSPMRHYTLTSAHRAAGVIYMCNNTSAKPWWSVRQRRASFLCQIPEERETLTSPSAFTVPPFHMTPPPPAVRSFLCFNTVFFPNVDRFSLCLQCLCPIHINYCAFLPSTRRFFHLDFLCFTVC